MAVIINCHTVITNPSTKYRREYYIKLKWALLIKYEQKSYPRELDVILTYPSGPFFHQDMGEWVRVCLKHRSYLKKKHLHYDGTQGQSEEGGWGY